MICEWILSYLYSGRWPSVWNLQTSLHTSPMLPIKCPITPQATSPLQKFHPLPPYIHSCDMVPNSKVKDDISIEELCCWPGTVIVLQNIEIQNVELQIAEFQNI
jgi:hypothetical protein